MEKQKMIFITGGARSGKSSFAEKLAVNNALQNEDAKLIYIACGLASDTEMKERIMRHQRDRAASIIPWRTIECPVQLKNVDIPLHSVVLIDCVTTLLSNEMYTNRKSTDRDIVEEIVHDIKCIEKKSSILVVVSNELQNDLPIRNEFVFDYQRRLGKLHQQLVKFSSETIVMEAGIPVYKKRWTR